MKRQKEMDRERQRQVCQGMVVWKEMQREQEKEMEINQDIHSYICSTAQRL